ncbi:MAG: hypothetical protein HY782_03490 [Chloroflexi bacterium]|nr:hypothetical protein [Chloroflexota bacterium]
MNWRNTSVIVVLILANYLVFGTLATFVFPPTPVTAPTRLVKATFTPGVVELQNVGTLTYDFLTPTKTPTFTPTVTITATGTVRTPTAVR